MTVGVYDVEGVIARKDLIGFAVAERQTSRKITIIDGDRYIKV